MEVAIEDLIDFLEVHKETIETLTLHEFGLQAGSDRSWMQVAESVRRLLRLSHADMRVYELTDDNDALDNKLYQWGRPLVAELTR